jgi:hypothetical protein
MYAKPIDPWQEAADRVQSIEGLWLKHNGKTGQWTLDGVSPGALQIAVIMSTAMHGVIKFEDGRVTRKPIRYEDRAPDPDEEIVTPPLTEVLCVGMDQDHVGQLMTFSGSSWGARGGFSKLIKPFRRKGCAEFPVCELGSKERHDKDNNHAPILTPVDWVSRDRFPDLVPPERTKLPAPESRPMLTSGRQAPPMAVDEADDAYRGPDPDAIERF